MNKNRGQNHARNLGIEKSTAEIVTIMDSDDQDYGNDLTPIVEYFKIIKILVQFLHQFISKK